MHAGGLFSRSQDCPEVAAQQEGPGRTVVLPGARVTHSLLVDLSQVTSWWDLRPPAPLEVA